MAAVYTTLSPTEVRQQILNVGASASVLHELQARVRRLGATPELAASASATHAWAVIHFIRNNLPAMNTRTLFDTQAPKFLKGLVKNSEEGVSAAAAQLYTQLHADWMSQQASKLRNMD